MTLKTSKGTLLAGADTGGKPARMKPADALCGKFRSALGAAAGEHFAAVFGGHSLAETVFF